MSTVSYRIMKVSFRTLDCKSHSHRFCNLFQLICGTTGIFFNLVNWFLIFEHHFCKGQIFLFYTLFHSLFDTLYNALFNTLFNKCFSKITHILHLAFKFFCHGNAEIILKTGFLRFHPVSQYGQADPDALPVWKLRCCPSNSFHK